MLRVPGIRLLFVWAALAVVCIPVASRAQDDPNEVPLGDVARNLRKNAPVKKQVIDDDNLSDVMEQADSRQGFGSTLRYLMAGDNKGFQVAAPDVTCSLAFTANVKSLLSNTQYSQMDLPSADLAKLEGPATIEGDALTVTLFNATNWHLSEIAVAFTVVRKATADESGADGAGSAIQDVRPEKKQDTTVIYRMRAGAPPWMRAAFSAPLNLDIVPGDEWHWAIVQARGYPPQAPAGSLSSAATVPPAPVQPAVATPASETSAMAPAAQPQQ